MDNGPECRVPVYKLLFYKHVLKQMLSFSDTVRKCNFTTINGWRGKTYVDTHDVCEYKPALRGVEIMDVYYLTLSDTVVLTDDQYRDYMIVAAVGH